MSRRASGPVCTKSGKLLGLAGVALACGLHRIPRAFVHPSRSNRKAGEGMSRGTKTTRIVAALVALAVLALLAIPAGEAAAGSTRKLPKEYRRSPYTLMSLSVGYPNHGWQVRAKKLRPNRYLRVKRSSRNNVYGHPALVLMLRRSAREIGRAVSGSVMVVGDLSRKSGGALAGHKSHQSGRDADIAFYMKDAQGRNHVPDRFVAFDGNGKARDGSGLVFDDYRNWLVVQSWVRDRRAGLSHIFVSRALRARLLAYGRKTQQFKQHADEVARLLKQPENSTAHDDHFHVRISCPRRQSGLCHEHPRR